MDLSRVIPTHMTAPDRYTPEQEAQISLARAIWIAALPAPPMFYGFEEEDAALHALVAMIESGTPALYYHVEVDVPGTSELIQCMDYILVHGEMISHSGARTIYEVETLLKRELYDAITHEIDIDNADPEFGPGNRKAPRFSNMKWDIRSKGYGSREDIFNHGYAGLIKDERVAEITARALQASSIQAKLSSPRVGRL